MDKQIPNLTKNQEIYFTSSQVVRIFLMIVLLLLTSVQAMQDGYRYRVRGRAVDGNGQPVPHAYIVVDAGPPTTWEDFTYFVESDESGNFLFYEAEETTDPKQTRFLYVIGPLPRNAYSIINPPFNRFPQLTGNSFAGRLIAIKKNAEIDVGEVPIQIRYGVINVHLQDRNGNPLIRNAKAWKYVWLRVRNKRGEIVTEGSVSINEIEKSVNVPESSVTVALPEGTWYVEVSPNEDKGPWLTSNNPLTVKALSGQMQLTLQLPTVSRKRRAKHDQC
jgi:hypothetical protein